MSVFSRLFSLIKNSQIPVIIATTEIIITTNNFLLLNLSKFDLLSSEMDTHYIKAKIPFNNSCNSSAHIAPCLLEKDYILKK
jgi:hypothetical protein